MNTENKKTDHGINDNRFAKVNDLTTNLRDITFNINTLLNSKFEYLFGVDIENSNNLDIAKVDTTEKIKLETWIDKIIHTQNISLDNCKKILILIENI